MMDEELILQNIEEFVKDENKIVSYAWLSSNLDIDVDKAKLLVENYAIKNGLIKPGLEVTYLLAGTLETTGEYIVEVVRQCDLEKVTAQFKEIQSEHIYSVQKELILKDSTLQSFFDDQIIFDNKRQGLIEYLEALPLSPEEMTVLREKSFTTTKTKDDKQHLSQTHKEAQNILPKVLEQSTLKMAKDAHDGISAIDKNEINTKRDSFKTPAESKEEDVALFTNLGSQKVKHGQENMQNIPDGGTGNDLGQVKSLFVVGRASMTNEALTSVSFQSKLFNPRERMS
uniref:DNA polymerase delta subunit 3 n=1 Tax=Timema douglasi TaxID=61478 RepID=A0A7R8VTF5_TIMDO|nr:unnamed protein product [Timema douglasi]